MGIISERERRFYDIEVDRRWTEQRRAISNNLYDRGSMYNHINSMNDSESYGYSKAYRGGPGVIDREES